LELRVEGSAFRCTETVALPPNCLPQLDPREAAMNLLRSLSRWAAQWSSRRRRRGVPDGGDMGTAFGLDSITVIDSEPAWVPSRGRDSTPRTHWEQRSDGRSHR
jgi:hypothetical protein